MDLYKYIYIYHIFSIFQPYLVIVACVWTLIPTRIKTTLWSMSLSLDPSPCLSLDIWAHELKRQSARIRCKKLLQSWILHVPCATHFAKSIQIDNIIPYEDLYIPLQPSHSFTHLVPCNLEALFQVRWVSCFNRCSVTLPSTLAQDGTFTCPLPYLAVLMSGEEMGRDCCGETKRGSLVAIFCGDSWDLNSSTAPFFWTCDLCWLKKSYRIVFGVANSRGKNMQIPCLHPDQCLCVSNRPEKSTILYPQGWTSNQFHDI